MRRHEAVLVGINQYRDKPLRGCVNDVHRMAGLLADQYGLAPQDMTVLIDGQATRAAIMDALAGMVHRAHHESRLVFHFSGHGLQLPARVRTSEWDGLDECLVPVDFSWDRLDAIRDDDLQALFEELPVGAQLWWVADSCHSGSLARESGWLSPAQLIAFFRQAGRTAKTMPFPRSARWIKTVVENHVKSFNPLGFRHVVQRLPGVALVSACEAGQTADDTRIDGQACGFLTYWLDRMLQQDQWRRASLVDLAAGLRAQAGGRTQTPQVEGPPDMLAGPFLGVR